MILVAAIVAIASGGAAALVLRWLAGLRTTHPTEPASPGTGDALVEAIDALLPQTQCGQCGFAGCRPYAEALARGEAGIDHCPPGGDAGARALAGLLGRPARPVDPLRGMEKPPQLAWIRELDCIGCTKCIQACPVDAIVGASKRMHTVIAELCTGCELCLPPCPVDCIELHPATPDQPGSGALQSLSTR